MYYTAGGWIEAFLKSMNDLLVAHSGIISVRGLRYRAVVCREHEDCVTVELDGHVEHVPFRDHDPAYAAHSLRDHYRRRTEPARNR